MAEIPLHCLRKYNGTNYRVWRHQLVNVLISSDLLGYVDGSEKEPENSA